MSKARKQDVMEQERPAVVVEQSERSRETAPVVDRGLVAQLVGGAREQGMSLDGGGGLLAQLTKLVLESALEGEITDHLGRAKHERAGEDRDGNARNGKRAKTVLTQAGPVEIDVPRDRDGSFQPAIVKKRQRRLGSIEDVVLSLSARGMTHGDIGAHLADVYGSEVSKTTISTITDKVLDGMAEWQGRPLDPVYPVVFIDAIHVKVRDGQVTNRPIYVALAVTVDGNRDILGLWVGDGGEGAKYWQQVLTEIKNRGVQDILMLVCDGLKGLPDAVNAVWPATIVQTCIVHLMRASFRYAARQDWDKIARALKPVYQAATVAEAEERFWSSRRPGAASTPRSSGSGPTPGRSSCRSCSSTARSAGSCAPPTRSSPSTRASARLSRPAATSRTSRPL
jgi:transposase-like protein